MDKAHLESLADARIAEAQTLIVAGQWPGAYYLAGYAVECALKACIAGLFKSEVFPEKTFAQGCYVHDIEKLVVLADLKATRDAATAADADLSANWGIAKDWSEQSRYELKDQPAATALVDAITDVNHGVLPWIKLHW